MAETVEVLIVGGGPAGLSAALLLGRCRRRVLVCDAGRPRNAAAMRIHGFLTRDGTTPAELRAFAKAELARYPTVLHRDVEALAIEPSARGFVARMSDGSSVEGRKLVLATGVVDRLPAIDGLRDLYGRGVHHCPYCDAFEYAGQPLAAFGGCDGCSGLALGLTQWSDDVVACIEGEVSERWSSRLTRAGVAVERRRIARLEGDDGRLRRIRFADGGALERSALFFSTGHAAGCALAERLGCVPAGEPTVATAKYGATGQRGIYVVGDASRDAQLVVSAAAEGAEAAIAINQELTAEDLESRPVQPTA